MIRFSDKWLPLLLALLLGMAPFVRVDATSAPEPHASAHDMHASIHHMTMQDGNCDSCKTTHHCATGSCSCYQCGSCSVTILHNPLSLPHTSPIPLIATGDAGELTAHPFLLFRPPRA